MLNGLTQDQQQLMEFDREWGLKSTFYLGKRILGYNFDEKPHRELCNFIDDERGRSKLLLAPAGCYKTSVISQAYVTRRIIKNPNIRILLDSVALSNSQDNLKVSRGFFEGNDQIKELYGDFSGGAVWNDTEYTVSKRTNPKLKEPTVRASGIDKVQIGPHYDLIIVDDIHSRENYKTTEQIEKVKEHLRLIFGRLEPNGEFIIGGHRWSYVDVYSMVMGDTDKPADLKFAELFAGNHLIRSATLKDGSLYFPRVLTAEHLKKQRTMLGLELYSAMLENEPVIEGDGQRFQDRNFKRYKELPDEAKDPVKLNWYLTLDIGGRKDGNDLWCLFEAAIAPNGNKYFVRYKKTLTKATAMAELIYEWFLQRKKQKRNHITIGVEIAGQQGLVLDSMKDWLWERYKVALPFKELPHGSNTDKDTRVEAMGPHYEMGKIYHSEQMSELFGLEDQLKKWPKGKKDVADAASMMEEVMHVPKVKKVDRPPASLDERIARHIDERFSGKSKIKRVHPILGSDY